MGEMMQEVPAEDPSSAAAVLAAYRRSLEGKAENDGWVDGKGRPHGQVQLPGPEEGSRAPVVLVQVPAVGRAAHRQTEEWPHHLQIVHKSWNARGGAGQEEVGDNVRLRQQIVLR